MARLTITIQVELPPRIDEIKANRIAHTAHWAMEAEMEKMGIETEEREIQFQIHRYPGGRAE